MEAGTSRASDAVELLVLPSDEEIRIGLRGGWDLSSAPRLREELDGVNAASHVVFDFSETTYLDSSTIRVLVEFKRRSSSQKGTTAIYYGDNERARRIFSISGVGTLL